MAVKTKNEYREDLNEAMKNKDSESLVDALAGIAKSEALELLTDTKAELDQKILAERGQRRLTSSELDFYNKLKSTEGMKRSAISNIDLVLPETVLDHVLDDIAQNHPLISKLDVIHVNADVKVLFTTADTNIAVWGELGSEITNEASFGFKKIDAAAMKLSAYMVIPNDYLKLGPAYIDQLVRTYLYEAIAKGIEKAVLTNLKPSEGPVGMMADLSKLSGTADSAAYTAKTAIAVTEWTPKGLAPVLKKMAKTEKGNQRPIDGLFLVVNPEDNYGIVKPALMAQNGLGEWVTRSPYPVDVIESPYMEAGKAVLGMAGKYALGICTTADGNIEYSDEFKFLADARTYKIIAHGNGQPKDNGAFQVLNIAGLKESALFTKTSGTTTTGA